MYCFYKRRFSCFIIADKNIYTVVQRYIETAFITFIVFNVYGFYVHNTIIMKSIKIIFDTIKIIEIFNFCK